MERPVTKYPYITIEYCTQCKWLLRAAYFAQELLSTFSTSLGEVSLRPSTGGTFVIEIYSSEVMNGEQASIQKHVLWDRKAENGFPETKELKRRVRDLVDPSRNLGHVDGHPKAAAASSTSSIPAQDTERFSADTEHTTALAIPKAINRLQAGEGFGERKFTPMDLDIKSRPVSSNGERDINVDRGKMKIGEDGTGLCRPGDEDCG